MYPIPSLIPGSKVIIDGFFIMGQAFRTVPSLQETGGLTITFLNLEY